MSLKQMILNYLADGAWHFGGQVEDYIRREVGSKASNASRRLRELVKEGKIENDYRKVGKVRVVVYRLKAKDIPTLPKPQTVVAGLFPQLAEYKGKYSEMMSKYRH